MATIKDVAAQASVSIATVSHVVNGTRFISDEVRERVQRAIAELDYQPNRVARNLRSSSTRTIGVIVSDIQNPFFPSVVRGIEDVLQAAEYTLLLGNSDWNLARERLYLATLRAEGVAGIIFTPSSEDVTEYQQFLKSGIPMVAIDRAPVGWGGDAVTVMNMKGAQDAVAHLIGQGHRRIGLINGPLQIGTAYERQTGYEQALIAGSLPIIPELIRNTDFRQTGGYETMNELLNLAEPPTATFIANNLMTLGAIQALYERNLHMPADMALIGFDDVPWAIALQVPLTTVAQPTYALGATAARLLLERLREPKLQSRHVVLETQLLVRASSGVEQATVDTSVKT
jgi:LacI family transcriptional regulator